MSADSSSRGSIASSAKFWRRRFAAGRTAPLRRRFGRSLPGKRSPITFSRIESKTDRLDDSSIQRRAFLMENSFHMQDAARSTGKNAKYWDARDVTHGALRARGNKNAGDIAQSCDDRLRDIFELL